MSGFPRAVLTSFIVSLCKRINVCVRSLNTVIIQIGGRMNWRKIKLPGFVYLVAIIIDPKGHM